MFTVHLHQGRRQPGLKAQAAEASVCGGFVGMRPAAVVLVANPANGIARDPAKGVPRF